MHLKKSFYQYVLSYRGGDWSDSKARFAEAMFEDVAFPKNSTSFDELSAYIEMQADPYMTTSTFDELWDMYNTKYNLYP